VTLSSLAKELMNQYRSCLALLRTDRDAATRYFDGPIRIGVRRDRRHPFFMQDVRPSVDNRS
jgi:hypothetical protein